MPATCGEPSIPPDAMDPTGGAPRRRWPLRRTEPFRPRPARCCWNGSRTGNRYRPLSISGAWRPWPRPVQHPLPLRPTLPGRGCGFWPHGLPRRPKRVAAPRSRSAWRTATQSSESSRQDPGRPCIRRREPNLCRRRATWTKLSLCPTPAQIARRPYATFPLLPQEDCRCPLWPPSSTNRGASTRLQASHHAMRMNRNLTPRRMVRCCQFQTAPRRG